MLGRKRYALSMLLCALMWGLSSSLGSGSIQASPQKKLTVVRVGYIPITALIGLYTGVERGYFRKQNIDLRATSMVGGAVIIPALQGGSLDIGYSNPISVLQGVSHGLNIVAVTRGQFETRAHPTNALLVPSDSPVRSARDLEGKTLAVNTLNNLAHVGVEQWIHDHGGDAAKVHFTELGFPQMLAPLTHGQIDAAAEAEPFVEIGRSTMGLRVLGYQFADEQKRTLTGSFVALRPWAKSHAGVLNRFVKAFNQGQAWADKHGAQARLYLTKYANMSPELAVKTALQQTAKIRPKDLSRWITLSIRWHVLDKKVEAKKILWSTATK